MRRGRRALRGGAEPTARIRRGAAYCPVGPAGRRRPTGCGPGNADGRRRGGVDGREPRRLVRGACAQGGPCRRGEPRGLPRVPRAAGPGVRRRRWPGGGGAVERAMVLLGGVGLAAGALAPRWAVSDAERRRAREVERHLSEMLEVTALGLRSGLSFDRSFELYGTHFETPFAEACASARRRWSLGLTTRDEALRDLAATYDSEQLARVVENMVRSLRFGSSLAESLESAAAEARAEHRARLEERVAKAPVKMMMPTGALILPAMLLLVLGPVLLELANGF